MRWASTNLSFSLKYFLHAPPIRLPVHEWLYSVFLLVQCNEMQDKWQRVLNLPLILPSVD